MESGCAGKSKKGELSLFPETFQVLSPCLHMLPLRKAKLENQVSLSLGDHLLSWLPPTTNQTRLDKIPESALCWPEPAAQYLQLPYPDCLAMDDAPSELFARHCAAVHSVLMACPVSFRKPDIGGGI